jgi:hypothetical protein
MPSSTSSMPSSMPFSILHNAHKTTSLYLRNTFKIDCNLHLVNSEISCFVYLVRQRRDLQSTVNFFFFLILHLRASTVFFSHKDQLQLDILSPIDVKHLLLPSDLNPNQNVPTKFREGSKICNFTKTLPLESRAVSCGGTDEHCFWQMFCERA